MRRLWRESGPSVGAHWQHGADAREVRGDTFREGRAAARAALALRDDHLATLARTIETEVIPRLLRAHAAPPTHAAGATGRIRPGDVACFADAILTEDDATARHCLDELRSARVPLGVVCRDLLGPAARLLGVMWVDDRCDFTTVTVGVGRLQRLLREYGDRLPFEHPGGRRGLAVLVVPVPGEQHTLGLLMVMEFFRRAGWTVSGGPGATLAEVRQQVRNERYDLIGLSLASRSRAGEAAACIRTVRQSSRNRQIGVMVGGRAFTEDAGLGAGVGADTTVADGGGAPAQAERLLAARADAAAG